MRINLWSPKRPYHLASIGPPPPTYLHLFENTPQLRHLHLCKFAWNIDWSALTVIHLRNPYGLSLPLGHLSRVSRLEELNIYGYFGILPDTTPVTLPFLKILRTADEMAQGLFRTPMLQELCIKNIISAVEPEGTSFRDTISICLPSLLHLTKLTLCTNRTDDVENLLRCMPAVSDLCLYVGEPEYNSLVMGFTTEYCMRVWSTHTLELLTECPKVRCLKTLTVGLLRCNENCLSDITTWIRRKICQTVFIGSTILSTYLLCLVPRPAEPIPILFAS